MPWPPSSACRIALAAAVALSCSPPGGDDAGAWQVVDLWRQPATVTGASGSDDAAAARGAVVTLRARQVKAVEHRSGDQLSWRLELGSEPVLSFRPNAIGGRCDFEVLARRPGGGLRSVYRGNHEPRDRPEAEERGDPLGDQVDVDLSRFAGRSVELVFRVAEASQSTCERAQWASPTVASLGGARRSGGERPNVILIAADTLRADALGTWGRTPSVTPNLDRLAAGSDVWLRAYASCNSTNPSFASLMTGLYVKNHGIFNLKTPLPEGMTTLAELLQAEGYATSAVLSVRHLARFSGLGQGFDQFRGPPGQFFAETAVNLAIQQLQELSEPFFLWLHLFDPHTPQNPPAPFHLGYRPAATFGLRPVGEWTPFREPGPRPFDFSGKQPRLLGHADLYPGEVSYLDWQLGRLLDFLDSRELLDDTLLVFVADHGESLGEHNIYFNHVGLFDQTVHVPLMIRWPGQTEGAEHRMLVQHFDVFPTILRYLGIEPPPNDGIDLRAAVEQGRGRPAAFANHANDRGEMVRTRKYKYYRNRVHYHARGVAQPAPLLHPRGDYFFDLAADPREQQNLAGSGHPQESALAAALDRWLASGQAESREALDLDPADLAQLEALGYVQ